jgi:hypothetical protein
MAELADDELTNRRDSDMSTDGIRLTDCGMQPPQVAARYPMVKKLPHWTRQ